MGESGRMKKGSRPLSHYFIPNLGVVRFLTTICLAVLVGGFGFVGLLHETGVSVYRVASDSMVPAFKTGDVVLVSKDAESLTVGDIAVYRSDWHSGLIVHRVVDVSDGSFTFQGDANKDSDPQVVEKKDILGEVVASSSVLGFVYSPPVVFGFTYLAALMLIVEVFTEFTIGRISSYDRITYKPKH